MFPRAERCVREMTDTSFDFRRVPHFPMGWFPVKLCAGDQGLACLVLQGMC